VPRQALSSVDRLSEILFGLIMVLTFTGSLSIAQAGRDDVRTMLIGALGCNIAWGLIDAVLFLMGALAERNESLTAWNAARKAGDPEAGRRVVEEALPPVIASVMTPDELESVRQRLVALPHSPPRVGLDATNWRGAASVFLLVVATTFPVVVPFLLSENAHWALRMSNAIAISMLFITGYAFARLTGRQPWLTGILMVLLGAALVALTMALGG
jgi:cytochrome bd-type quinol oxidase subunit 1